MARAEVLDVRGSTLLSSSRFCSTGSIRTSGGRSVQVGTSIAELRPADSRRSPSSGGSWRRSRSSSPGSTARSGRLSPRSTSSLRCARPHSRRPSQSTRPGRTLGEIAEIVGGVTKDTKRQHDPSFVEVPYLRVANVQRGYLDLSEIATIRVPDGQGRSARTCDPVTSCSTRAATGTSWDGAGSGPARSEAASTRTTSSVPGCVTGSIRSSSHGMGTRSGVRGSRRTGAQTTNLASLNLTTLKSFPVPAPPLDHQQAAGRRPRGAGLGSSPSMEDATVAATRRARVCGARSSPVPSAASSSRRTRTTSRQASCSSGSPPSAPRLRSRRGGSVSRPAADPTGRFPPARAGSTIRGRTRRP